MLIGRIIEQDFVSLSLSGSISKIMESPDSTIKRDRRLICSALEPDPKCSRIQLFWIRQLEAKWCAGKPAWQAIEERCFGPTRGPK